MLRQGQTCNVVLESAAFEQLHHDELLLVVLADLVHCTDVRMIERRGSTRFPQESLERALIFRQILGQELQGHGSPQNKVFGTVNDSHATASKLFENAVVGHSRTKHRAHSGSYRANLRSAVLASQRMWRNPVFSGCGTIGCRAGATASGYNLASPAAGKHGVGTDPAQTANHLGPR